jgi:hypothetical protein
VSCRGPGPGVTRRCGPGKFPRVRQGPSRVARRAHAGRPRRTRSGVADVVTAVVSIRVRGGAIGRVDPDETAFADRESPFLLSIDSTWADPADDEANVAWTRALWDAMEPYSTGRMYFNFAMLEEGEETTRATFGGNSDRPVDVKNRYDPENRLRLNQNIEPTV